MNFGQRFHRWYLVLGLAACTVYLALPPSSAAQCLFLVIALSAPAVGILGIVDDHPNPRAGWWLLCAGFAIAGLAEVADFVVVTMSVRPDLEAVIQVVFLTAYIVQLCGLMTIVQARSVSKHQFGWFDATAVGVCVFTVIWSTLYEAIFRHNPSSPLELAHPVRWRGARRRAGRDGTSSRHQPAQCPQRVRAAVDGLLPADGDRLHCRAVRGLRTRWSHRHDVGARVRVGRRRARPSRPAHRAETGAVPTGSAGDHPHPGAAGGGDGAARRGGRDPVRTRGADGQPHGLDLPRGWRSW